jgi:menaquinone-dependent protoporphyrinogen IX oxidase
MNNQVLVTYSTCTGFTKIVSEVICETLVENGIPAEIYSMKNVKDIYSYKAVIAGSGIQGRKWLPEAIQFVKENQVILSLLIIYK